ncbi:MAG: hypothetical protein WBD49_10545 [Bradyrhizobium sp.]
MIDQPHFDSYSIQARICLGIGGFGGALLATVSKQIVAPIPLFGQSKFSRSDLLSITLNLLFEGVAHNLGR